MSVIGKRTVDLFIGAAVELYRPATQATTTIYLSNRSWITNPNDSVAANRQYVGLLTQAYQIDYSWFSGDTIGGRSKRNFGQLRAINPDGAHSLQWIFEEGWKVQGRTITYHIGRVGDDLADMITFTLTGRHVRESEDGFEVHIDLSDDGQALDSSVFIDKFQGLGPHCVRCDSAFGGEVAAIADHASLNPASAFYFHVAYRLPSWADMSIGAYIAGRNATGGGQVYRIDLLTDGTIRITSRTSAGVAVVLNATDLEWSADGRWHHVVGKWDNTSDTLQAFHSTRTGGVKSAITAAQATIRTGTDDLEFGDLGGSFGGNNDYVDIGLVALAVDADVPTDAEIIDRLKRDLTTAEGNDCVAFIDFVDGTGTTATDASGNGNDATVANNWQPTFEGTADLTGTAKPLAFGRIFNAPITWSDRENGIGNVHARCFKGAVNAYEGAAPLVIGWPRTRFQNVTFTAASNTISLPTRTAGGATRYDAQPGFSGLKAGQQIVIVGTASNDGTRTLASDSTERTIVLTSGIVNESSVDAFLTANGASGADPDIRLWHEAGGVQFTAVPTLPVTFELLGDIGAEIPTDSSSVHFPEYAPAILRELLITWGGISAGDVSTNWDDGTNTPDNPAGAYFAQAGVWLDPARDRTIRDVMDEGALSVWARWGQYLANDTWDLLVIEAPSGTADVDLDSLSILGLRRIQSIPPIGGLTLRSTVNYAPLKEGEVAGTADAATAAALRREYLEGAATPDSTVLAGYPFADIPEPISTWILGREDAQTEAQRRYDVLKVEREMYDAQVILYGLDQNPLAALLTLTDEDFGTLASGKDFWIPHLQAVDEAVTLTGWG